MNKLDLIITDNNLPNKNKQELAALNIPLQLV